MTAQTLWRLCIAAGVLVLALTRPLDTSFPKQGHAVAAGYGTPIIAFEMASTPADLEAVFGPSEDAQRHDRLDGMDTGNRWDFAFMAAYGSFIFLFFWAACKETGNRMWWLLAALGVVAACADGIENSILLNLTAELRAQDLSGVAPDLGRSLELLAYPVWTKFLSLMMAGFGAGVHLVLRRRPMWTVLGIVVMLGASTVALGFYAPASYTKLMGPGIGVLWGVQLIYALTRWKDRGVG